MLGTGGIKEVLTCKESNQGEALVLDRTIGRHAGKGVIPESKDGCGGARCSI